MFRRSQAASPPLSSSHVLSSSPSSDEADSLRSPPDDADEATGFVRSHRRVQSGSLDLEAYGAELEDSSGRYPNPRTSSYSTYTPRRDSLSPSELGPESPPDLRKSGYFDDKYEDGPPIKERLAEARKNPDVALLWNDSNTDVDDYLHQPDPAVERHLDRQFGFSWSRLFDSSMLIVLIVVIVGLFGGCIKGGFATNIKDSTTGRTIPGQVPNTTLPGLIDAATPTNVYSRKGFDGNTYNLVFSDEFNNDGRTFWPGDDPWWEAVDLWYSGTSDYEWYDPDAIVTKDGSLQITLSEEPIHGLNFRSGMLQSWNKFCFTGGYVEVNLSLPGNSHSQGFWSAAWTLGNLARAGYGSSNDGVWPYSYSSADVGTLPNQTWPNGTSPTAAKTTGNSDYGGELSWLPGQRLSAATCEVDSAEHPGPNVGVGRGAPEIDIIEAMIDSSGLLGSASQSYQFAPMNAGYKWLNTTPYTVVYNSTATTQNQWMGEIYQESASQQTVTDSTSYEGAGYSTFGYEYVPGDSGKITWAINGTHTWQINASAMGPDSETEIGQRFISNEPMSVVFNLAISSKSGQTIQWDKITFPATLRIDYIRVYQEDGKTNVGCDPPDYPTSDYINNHPLLYSDANLTTFKQSNYTVPRNSLSATGCA